MELSPLYHNTRPDGELLPQEAAAFDLLEQLGIDTPVCKVLSQVVRCIQGNYDKQYLK